MASRSSCASAISAAGQRSAGEVVGQLVDGRLELVAHADEVRGRPGTGDDVESLVEPLEVRPGAPFHRRSRRVAKVSRCYPAPSQGDRGRGRRGIGDDAHVLRESSLDTERVDQSSDHVSYGDNEANRTLAEVPSGHGNGDVICRPRPCVEDGAEAEGVRCVP